MNQRRYSLLAAALLAGGALAADRYTVDHNHAYPVFEVSHLGFSTQRGRFNKAGGRISLDLAARKGEVEYVIDTASIDMGTDEWDKHMKGEDFLHVEKFPTMTYAADQLVFKRGKPVAAKGTLTLRGVSRPVRLAIANFRCGLNPLLKKEACGADISATFKRSEFGMDKHLPAVGDTVRIKVPVEAIKD